MENSSTQFKKGMIPWNKGIPHSEETLKKISERLTGRISKKKGIRNRLTLTCVQCGIDFYVVKSQSYRKCCGLNCQKKYLSGSGNYRWIKDRSLLKDDYHDRGGQLHREWSRSVKNRDGWKCKISNSDCSGKVFAHHILTWRDHEELRYEVNNGITLCHFHHPRKRNDEISLAPFFQRMVLSIA